MKKITILVPNGQGLGPCNLVKAKWFTFGAECIRALCTRLSRAEPEHWLLAKILRFSCWKMLGFNPTKLLSSPVLRGLRVEERSPIGNQR